MSAVSIWQNGGPSSTAAGASNAAAQLPPGGKFVPTDGELLGYYLYNHIRRTLPSDHYSVIRHHDLYGDDEPWEIWKLLQSGEQPGDVYVFTNLKKKVKSGGGKGTRCDRKVGKSGGSWHREDKGTEFSLIRRARSPLEKDERWIGTRKRFNYRNPNPNFANESEKWILHEFGMTKDGRCDEESEVVCLLRNNGSPSANAVVEAARSSALARRKRKLEDYIMQLGCAASSSKRACYNPDPQIPLPSSAVECSSSSSKAPLSTMVLEQQPEPVEQEQDSTTLDIISIIDFDSLGDEFDFDCGDQGGSCTDPQSVLDFPQVSSDDHDDYEHHSATATETVPEEANEPLYLLQPPAPTADSQPAANPLVDEDQGKKIMVVVAENDGQQAGAMAAAVADDTPEGTENIVVANADNGGQATDATMERIVLPLEAAMGGGGCCDYDYGSTDQVEMLKGYGFGGGGFSDLLDMPLSFEFPLCGFEQMDCPSAFVDLWNFGLL